MKQPWKVTTYRNRESKSFSVLLWRRRAKRITGVMRGRGTTLCVQQIGHQHRDETSAKATARCRVTATSGKPPPPHQQYRFVVPARGLVVVHWYTDVGCWSQRYNPTSATDERLTPLVNFDSVHSFTLSPVTRSIGRARSKFVVLFSSGDAWTEANGAAAERRRAKITQPPSPYGR